MPDRSEDRGEEGLEELLGRFEAQCPMPTNADVREWQARYPRHARALLARAAERAEAILALIGRIEDHLAVERAAGRAPPPRPWDPRKDCH